MVMQRDAGRGLFAGRARSAAAAWGAGFVLFAAAIVPGLAQSGPPASGGRFTMHPADGGVLRLDTETGVMSLCKAGTGGQWSCQSLPDERAALEKEIARLGTENKELQGAVKRLEEMAGIPPDKPERRADKEPGLGNRLPGPEDVDKAMTYLQSMLKKFREKLKEFEDLDGRRTEKL